MWEMIKFELKKILFRRQVVIGIIIIFLLSIAVVVKLNLIYVIGLKGNIEKFYHQYSGALTNELEQDIEKYGENNNYPRGVKQQLENLKSRRDNERIMREKAQSLLEYGEGTNNKNDIKKAKLLLKKYQQGEEFMLNQLEWRCVFLLMPLFFLLSIILILVSSSSFSIERDNNMNLVLYSMKNGRVILRIAKILAVYLFAFFINVVYFIWVFLILKVIGFDLDYADKPLFNVKGFEAACSDVTIIRYLFFNMLCFLVMSFVLVTIVMLVSRITQNRRISFLIGVLVIVANLFFEIQYYLRFWNHIAQNISEFSPEIQNYFTYEKAFSPFALFNPCYYFEKIHYGEFFGHLVPMYVFPILSSAFILFFLTNIICFDWRIQLNFSKMHKERK